MKEVGLTHGGFYKHFASKDELICRAITRSFDQMVARWEGYNKRFPSKPIGAKAQPDCRRRYNRSNPPGLARLDEPENDRAILARQDGGETEGVKGFDEVRNPEGSPTFHHSEPTSEKGESATN